MGAGASSTTTAAAAETLDEAGAKAVVESAGWTWDEACRDAFREAAHTTEATGETTRERFLEVVSRRLGDALTALTNEEREEEARLVLEAATERERLLASKTKKPSAAASDYSKSLSGTAKDTKDEKEAAALMRGDEPEMVQESASPYLRSRLEALSGATDRDRVEAAGKWLRFMGAAGCYLYIHSLTHEERSTRPEAYLDVPEAVESIADPYAGLPSVDVVDVAAEVRRIVSEVQKTPLILDASPDRKLATFFSFKGVLVDGSTLALPMRDKKRPKPKDFVEECRSKAVQAMKSGTVFAIDLGETEGSKAPFISAWCKNDGFRKEVFSEAGKSLARNKMALQKMFKDDEKEYGECIVRDDFCTVVITQLAPDDYAKELADSFDLDKFYPFVAVAADRAAAAAASSS